jgi:hypothetical protein
MAAGWASRLSAALSHKNSHVGGFPVISAQLILHPRFGLRYPSGVIGRPRSLVPQLAGGPKAVVELFEQCVSLCSVTFPDTGMPILAAELRTLVPHWSGFIRPQGRVGVWYPRVGVSKNLTRPGGTPGAKTLMAAARWSLLSLRPIAHGSCDSSQHGRTAILLRRPSLAPPRRGSDFGTPADVIINWYSAC